MVLRIELPRVQCSHCLHVFMPRAEEISHCPKCQRKNGLKLYQGGDINEDNKEMA